MYLLLGKVLFWSIIVAFGLPIILFIIYKIRYSRAVVIVVNVPLAYLLSCFFWNRQDLENVKSNIGRIPKHTCAGRIILKSYEAGLKARY